MIQPTPLEQAASVLGEHFDNYVIAVSNKPHECEVEYNNSFAAIGLLKTCEKIVDQGIFPTIDSDDDYEIVWEDDDDEDEEDEEVV